jgi:hypothetical protein
VRSTRTRIPLRDTEDYKPVYVVSLPLASNGLPYVVDSFTVICRSAGTEAFNEAEQEGTRLEVTPVDPAERVTEAMPLDQYVVSFD